MLRMLPGFITDPPKPTLERVVGTLGLIALVTVARWLLQGMLNFNVPFLLYFPSIMLIAWFAGTLCALLAIMLESAIAAWLFVPTGTDPLATMRIAIFVAGSVLIVWASRALHRARRDLISARQREASQRRRYELMLDSIVEAVIGLDADARVLYLNRAAEELSGQPLATASGRPLLHLLPLSDQSGARQVTDLDTLQQRPQGWLLAVDGREPVPVAVSLSKMRSDDASSGGSVLVLRLAFEERERARLNAETEAARADAEAANRMKDDFLRMVSHELRAPLNAILGWADVMLRKNDAATVTKGSETIRRNVRAQSALIDSMLDVAAIASGRFNIARRPTDIYDVIEEAHRSIEPLALGKKVSLAHDIIPGAPAINADTPRLQQVIANLYSNALKFTPSGGTITTRLRFDAQSLVLEVADSGQGMTPETLALLFERSEGSAALARSKSGLGLGLRIARRIVELHGGQLSARSEGDNLGATVTVALPWDAPLGGRPEAGSAEGLAPLVGRKVLVVDDDTQAALLLANVLEDLGAVVQTADTARRALDLYSRFEPDAMVSDIGMSDEDGYWLIAAIRSLESDRRLAKMPAMAVTAYTRPEDRERSRSAGFDGHLGKPVTARAVAHALAEAMARRPGHDSVSGDQ
jgi:PAS domain S-box-containing protein